MWLCSYANLFHLLQCPMTIMVRTISLSSLSLSDHCHDHFQPIKKKVLYCPNPEPPPLPLWGAWVQPPQLKGASPTQPHALSQVNKIFKSGSSSFFLHKCEILFISPPPGRVFTQCQFLPELNLWELPRGNGSPSKTNTHLTKQWWKHKKTVNHKHRVMWLTKQQ